MIGPDLYGHRGLWPKEKKRKLKKVKLNYR